MRPRRFLLLTAALSSAALGGACGKQRNELPGNPKGSFYDGGMEEAAPAPAEDAAAPEPETEK
jgi:hypothetical protein